MYKCLQFIIYQSFLNNLFLDLQKYQLIILTYTKYETKKLSHDYIDHIRLHFNIPESNKSLIIRNNKKTVLGNITNNTTPCFQKNRIHFNNV